MRSLRVAASAALGATVGLLAGLFLAAPFAPVLSGGMDLALVTAGLGALGGAGVALRPPAGRRREAALASPFTFKRSRADAEPPRREPRPAASAPPEETLMAEPRRDFAPASTPAAPQRPGS